MSVTGFIGAGKIKFVGKQPMHNRARSRVRYVFGPVPSRRLGVSLGLDLAPPKTCTLDCLYCEVGRTTHKTLDRFNLNMAEGLLDELAATLPGVEHRLDVITLAGSGGTYAKRGNRQYYSWRKKHHRCSTLCSHQRNAALSGRRPAGFGRSRFGYSVIGHGCGKNVPTAEPPSPGS